MIARHAREDEQRRKGGDAGGEPHDRARLQQRDDGGRQNDGREEQARLRRQRVPQHAAFAGHDPVGSEGHQWGEQQRIGGKPGDQDAELVETPAGPCRRLLRYAAPDRHLAML